MLDSYDLATSMLGLMDLVLKLKYFVKLFDEFKKFWTVYFNKIQHKIYYISYARLQRKR